MRRRAEQVDKTRQRITEAAVRLHTTIGPANTSISRVAAEADVTRLTVYRHFAGLDTLFVACMGHWSATNPSPDVTSWMAIESLEARARRAFGELYAWYADHDEELYPIYRDWSAMPESAREAMLAQLDGLAAAVLAGPDSARNGTERGVILVAAARHLVDYWTWRSLAVDRGLGPGLAAEAAVAMLRSTSR